MSTSSRHIALNPDLIGAPYAVTAVRQLVKLLVSP